MSDTIFAEIDRQKKLIDMMTSMHSDLSKKYRVRCLLLDSAIVLSSVVLLSCVFLDQSFLERIRINADTSRIIIGLSSIVMTGITMLSYVFNWKSMEIAHEQAFKSLLELKSLWRLFALDKENVNSKSLNDIESKTSLILNQLIAIDNSVFNKLKKRHYIKVQLSKTLSKYPFAPLFLIKLCSTKADFQEVHNEIRNRKERP
jgi:hypothetical protein